MIIKKKSTKKGICLGLVFTLMIGLIVPITKINVNAASNSKKVLVVYFSATGTTRSAAKKIKKATKGKLYQIKAADPYTEEDLDYSNDDCRANTEQQDEQTRPEIDGTVKNMDQYDIIFLGFPIWWGKEPMIIRTFLESYDLEGKKIIPFCTSGGSGISGSMEGIETAAENATVEKGKDLTDASYKSIKNWVKKKIK